MRLLFVVQRYGRQVAGGAELHCREFATRLAGRGRDVEVVTSCAVSYVDWADHYPSGTETLDGVTVHRLSVAAPRDDRLFGPLNARVVWGRRSPPLHMQELWMRMSGPLIPDVLPWLAQKAGGFDAVIFFTYLYYPTWAGLPVAASLVPTVLHPTAHHEPALYLPVFETMFRHPTAFAFSTEEEEQLVRRRFSVHQESAVIGIGVDLESADVLDDVAFREAHGLGDRPYLLYIGRLDPAKGSDELFAFFTAYKRRHPGPLALVMVGEMVRPLPSDPDVFVTGYLDEVSKRSAVAGALALVQPSHFESFAMVLTEAWAQRKPALVQGHCAVLDGQARRSGGAIPYRSYPEFEEAVEQFIADPALVRELGAAGRRYVEQYYEWGAVLDRYERFLARVTGPIGRLHRVEPITSSMPPRHQGWTAVERTRSPRRRHDVSSSVVIVSCKAHRWLKPCLESIIGQVDETVLVDNGSEGEAVSEVGRSLGVVVHRLPANVGYAAGVNVGLVRARGDVVALLNDDAMAEPGWIHTAALALNDITVAAVAPKIVFARRYVEVRVDEASTFAFPDPRPLARSVGRVTVDGRDVSLGSLVGPGIHELEEAVENGVRRQWRWTAGKGPIYIPIPGDADGVEVVFDEDPVRVVRVVRLVNNAGSYLSKEGYGGDYGFCARDDGWFDTPAERFAATGAAMVARSETFRRLGRMAAEFYAYYEDTDWCWRARLAGMHIRYEPANVVHHVGGVTSGGPANEWVRFLAARNRMHTLARNAPLHVLSTEVRRLSKGRATSGSAAALARRVPLGLVQRPALARNWARTPREIWVEWAGVDEQWPAATDSAPLLGAEI